MKKSDIDTYFRIEEELNTAAHSIINARRQVASEIQNVGLKHKYPPLNFYIDEMEKEASGIVFRCTAFGKHGYVEGFSETISYDDLTDPTCADNILALRKQQVKDREDQLAAQREMRKIKEECEARVRKRIVEEEMCEAYVAIRG